jgi:hypothetical protein
MSLTALLNRDCTIIRRTTSGTLDADGNDVPGETEVQTVCAIQQNSRTEHDGDGEVPDATWIVFLPFSKSLHSGDAIVVAGEIYEVVGEPARPQNGSEDMWHIEATVRRTAGTSDEVGS